MSEQLTTVIGILEDTAERMRLIGSGAVLGAVEPLRGYRPGYIQKCFSDTVRIASEIIDGLGGLPFLYEDSETNQQVRTVARTILSYNHSLDIWIFNTSPTGTVIRHRDQYIEVACTTPEIRQNYLAALEAQSPTPLHPRAV